MKLLSRFIKDRRVSAIVTVLVCMLLVIALGAALLYVSLRATRSRSARDAAPSIFTTRRRP